MNADDPRILEVPWCGGRVFPYYADHLVTLYHGDTRVIAPMLPAQTGRVHVLSDPPYSKHTHENSRAGARKVPLHGGDGKLRKGDISRAVDFGFDPLSWSLRGTIAEQSRRLATAWILLFSDNEGAATWREAIEEVGLHHYREGHWRKLNAPPKFDGRGPAADDESIEIAHQSNVKGKCLPTNWSSHGKHASWEHAVVIERGGRQDGEPRVHETQKPESLICELLEDFTQPGDMVIDFTSGGGTTLVCARRMGRRAIGIESRQDDCFKTVRRLQAEKANVSYHALCANPRTEQIAMGF